MLFLESVIEQVRAISDVRHPESKLLPLGVVHTGIMASFYSRIHCMRDPDSDCKTHGLIMGSDRVLLRYLGIQVLPWVYSASGIVVYQVCYRHWKQLLVAIFRDTSLQGVRVLDQAECSLFYDFRAIHIAILHLHFRILNYKLYQQILGFLILWKRSPFQIPCHVDQKDQWVMCCECLINIMVGLCTGIFYHSFLQRPDCRQILIHEANVTEHLY